MKNILTFIMGFGCLWTQAQTIEKFSIDSGGNITSNDNIAILYTIGEVNVQELNAGNILLSEGFISSNFGETLNIEVSSIDNQLLLYPNPAKDLVTFANLPLGETQIKVFDLSGKEVFSKHINAETTTINTTNFANGVYLVRINYNGNVAHKKLVVNK
ncbi:T9SS type A sorting domain-containing protein [Gelidibacter japonicus]|uniref:T9SS type A sorting domain-containing protein n=1 Tax=Gelidibacter japonicus TaxID=1962232 RepID=UPI002020849B|nr:T9SS type A sorting domain-containing protein [Gelidibacter japonicus]MCL8009303.1 T9SS type A sorting domain-containing protein [Gelidibacter japonicus]